MLKENCKNYASKNNAIKDDTSKYGISKHLKQVSSLPSDKISFQNIIDSLEEGGFFLLFIIFALPSALPIPAAGYSTVLCIPIIIFALQEIWGKSQASIPNFIGRRGFSKQSLRKAVVYVIRMERRLFFLIRPRLVFFASHYFKKLLALFCLILALFACIPLPLTNTIPCLAIVIISIGVLHRDGIVIFLGLVAGFLGMALATLAYLYGVEKVKEWFF